MTENNVVAFRPKDEIADSLTEILRSGAKRLIEQAVEAEFAAFLAEHVTGLNWFLRSQRVRKTHRE